MKTDRLHEKPPQDYVSILPKGLRGRSAHLHSVQFPSIARLVIPTTEIGWAVADNVAQHIFDLLYYPIFFVWEENLLLTCGQRTEQHTKIGCWITSYMLGRVINLCKMWIIFILLFKYTINTVEISKSPNHFTLFFLLPMEEVQTLGLRRLS